MKPPLLAALCAAFALFFVGCLPESKNPLSTPAGSRVDSRLDGVFQQVMEKTDRDRTYWHFHYRGVSAAPKKEPHVTTTLEVLGVGHVKSSGLDLGRYRAYAVHLGKFDYLSYIDESASRPGYCFARYEVNWLGEVKIWQLDNDRVAAAIRAGKLPGRVRKGSFGLEVKLTGSTQQLAAFFATPEAAGLFAEKPMVLRRIAR